MEQSVLSLARWFNDPLLSDIQIFVSREANAPSYYCHEVLLRLRSPKLVESLVRSERRLHEDASSATKKILIIEELEGKPDLAQLFLRVLYDEKAWNDDTCYPLLDVFEKFELYAFVWMLKKEVPEDAKTGYHFFELGRIVHETMPTANSENTHQGDLLVKLKDTEYTYHCHSLVLAHSLEYFRGLFRSGMKDSSTHAVTIELHADVAPDVFKQAFEALLQYAYRGSMSAVPLQEAFVVAYSLTVKYIAPQLEAELLRKVAFVSTTKSIGPMIYSALVYNAQPILEKVTAILIPKFTQTAAEDSFTVVPEDYLLEFSAGTPRRNAYQYAVHSQLDLLIVKALENIHTILGDNPELNLDTVDERGNTLLHLAVKGARRPHTLEYLVGKGLDLNAQNKDGMTPMDVMLNIASETETELQYPLAQLLILGASFDETKVDLIKNFLAIIAQFDMTNEVCLNAWPNAFKMMTAVLHKMPHLKDTLGKELLHRALTAKHYPMVHHLVFTLKVPTSRSVTLLKQYDDGVPRSWLPEHDTYDFSLSGEGNFKLNSKTYSMKDAEIFASEENYGSGSYESRSFEYHQLSVHTKDKPHKPIEFHGADHYEWSAFLNLLHFLWIKSNVPEERQVAAFTLKIREGSLRDSTEIKESLGNTAEALSSLGKLMSKALNISKK